MLKLKLQYFGHLMPLIWKLTHLKRPWCWERLKAGEGDDRGWDGWLASWTWWTWVWASSGSWWWTGKPGVLQSMGSQRVRHNWATELKFSIHSAKYQGVWFPPFCFEHAPVNLRYRLTLSRSSGRRCLVKDVPRGPGQPTSLKGWDSQQHRECLSHSCRLYHLSVISLVWSISQFKLLNFKPKCNHLSINWKLPQFMDLGGQCECMVPVSTAPEPLKKN